MIEIYYIVALGMGITNTYKDKVKKPLIPFLAFITCILLNILNAIVLADFSVDNIREAIKEAVMVGGVTIGIFNAGDITRKAIHQKQSV